MAGDVKQSHKLYMVSGSLYAPSVIVFVRFDVDGNAEGMMTYGILTACLRPRSLPRAFLSVFDVSDLLFEAFQRVCENIL